MPPHRTAGRQGSRNEVRETAEGSKFTMAWMQKELPIEDLVGVAILLNECPIIYSTQHPLLL